MCDFTTVWWMTTPQAGSSQPRIGCITDPGHGVYCDIIKNHIEIIGDLSLVLCCLVVTFVTTWSHGLLCPGQSVCGPTNSFVSIPMGPWPSALAQFSLCRQASVRWVRGKVVTRSTTHHSELALNPCAHLPGGPPLLSPHQPTALAQDWSFW